MSVCTGIFQFFLWPVAALLRVRCKGGKILLFSVFMVFGLWIFWGKSLFGLNTSPSIHFLIKLQSTCCSWRISHLSATLSMVSNFYDVLLRQSVCNWLRDLKWVSCWHRVYCLEFQINYSMYCSCCIMTSICFLLTFSVNEKLSMLFLTFWRKIPPSPTIVYFKN